MRVIYDAETGETTVDQDWQPQPEELFPLPVPRAVTRRQLRLWLVRSGYTLVQVEELIDALPEPQRTEARIEWEDATQFERDHPLLRQLAGQLLKKEGKELDAALDEAFWQAAAL